MRNAMNTARKARSYIHIYEKGNGGSQLLIEKFVKLRKSHRNILDLEDSYLEKSIIKMEEDVADVKIERELIAKEKREEEDAVKVKKERLDTRR